MERLNIYCDESGNTGSNYLDPQQPIYVLGGWSVYPDSVGGAEATILKCLGSSLRNTRELHGAQFLRSVRGQRATLRLFKELGSLGCVPFFVLAEKRYCIAGKIVETFLDPYYNPRVNNWITIDADTKQDIADIVYELPDEVLQQFAVAYRSPDSNEFRESLQIICRSLSLRLHTTVADAMIGSLPKIDDIVQAELISGSGVPGNAWRTLNMPVFVYFICRIEEVGRQIGASQITLVHDEIVEFQATFDWLLQIFKNPVKKVDIYLANGTMIPIGFEVLKSFRTVQSHVSPIIQAADLLARSLCAFGTGVYLNKPLHGGLVNIVKILLPATMVTPQVGMLVASRKFMGKLFAPVLNEQENTLDRKHDKVYQASCYKW